MNNNASVIRTSSQKRIIIAFIFVFIISVLIISALMYRVFNNNLAENLQTRATEVIDIIDYMAQTSGESPELTKGIKTLAANRDIRLIIVRINEPPVVIASNKAALIGLPTNENFSTYTGSQSFNFDSKSDLYTVISPIWLENKFSNGQFTKALVKVVFNTYKARTILQQQILSTSIYLILTTIFVIGIVFYLTNKYIFKPLELINSSLKQNNSENEFKPIPIVNNDEIGIVANTFNQLFEELYNSKKILHESTERYDLALQGTKVGLVDWDIISDEIYCSSSLIKILGIRTQNLLPNMQWITERTHPDDREAAESALISHLKFNTEYDVEGRLRHENGNYVWIRARGRALRDADGKAIRMVGYYVDISKRKENERFMNSLYMLSADASLSIDSKINLILREATKFLKLPGGAISKFDNGECIAEACQCPDVFGLCDISTLNAMSDFFLHTIEQNEIVCLHDVNDSSLHNTKANKEFGINAYIGIPLIVHGRIHGTVSFFDRKSKMSAFDDREKSFVRLLSEWIGNEIMRSQYIDYLHETESRLEDAVDELTTINTELESFTYLASHDLQEPLRMITNFTSILENNYNDNFDSTGKKYLKILSSSANQMRTLIKDLLDYAHASNIDYKVDEIDLSVILNHVYSNLEKQIRESNARILIGDMPTVQANKASMVSLLQNLISNAIKFQKPDQDPIIEVNSYKDCDSWVISISDNGIGIDENFQNKIFEPFLRLHTKSEYKGTGIGLAVCKKITSRLGGKIWIESTKGSGSTFYVSIPNLIAQTTGKAA